MSGAVQELQHGSAATDEHLILRYRDAGDTRAFEQLVHRYERPIYNYLLRYLRNAQLAEEVFQTTFLRVHQKIDSYQVDRPVRPWLYRIATHAAVDTLRREGRHQAARLDDGSRSADSDVGSLLETLESESHTPHEQAVEAERQSWTRRAVDELPEHLRQVVLLIYFQGLKYQETAEALNVPIGTVKSRAHAALNRLNTAWQRDHAS